MAHRNLNLNGVLVRLSKVNKADYVSLQDIAKGYSEDWYGLINDWIKNAETIEYLGLWESLENDNFNYVEFDIIKNEAGRNRFRISPTLWVTKTNAIGIIPGKRGRYSKGAFAQRDIALHFCYWLNPAFQLYLIREFDRLKTEEQIRIGDPFNIKRFLTAGSYSLLVNSLLSKVDERLLTHPQPYKKRLPFAAEADMINQIVFGQSAKQWRYNNPNAPTNRNQRDFASVLELVVLNCLEVIDAMLIQWDVIELKERQKILQETYNFIHPILKRTKTIQDLQELANKSIQ